MTTSLAERPISNEAAIHPLDIPFETEPVICYSTASTPFLKHVRVGMPKLGQYKDILDVVFFLYHSAEDARAGKNYGGTGFLVSIPTQRWPDQYHHIYGVSNWHVACEGGASVVRLNTKDGAHDIFDYGPELWQFLPGEHDIAVIPIAVQETHKAKYLEPKFLITDEQIKEWEIGPGDDVFMVGRFIDYDGVQTNNPSVRFGHISMIGAPIRQPNGCMDESFVLDMHSRAGYSGSPVFVYRTVGSHFLEGDKGSIIVGAGHTMSLLGIHWGQFPESWELKDKPKKKVQPQASMITDGKYVEGLSGMTCVCPAPAIWKALNMPKLKALRETTELQMEQQIGPASSLPRAELALPTKADNPQHREDFNSLLDAAVVGKKQGSET